MEQEIIEAEIDLSNLLHVSVDFNSLQVVLRLILKKIRELSATQDGQKVDLSSRISGLEDAIRNSASRDGVDQIDDKLAVLTKALDAVRDDLEAVKGNSDLSSAERENLVHAIDDLRNQQGTALDALKDELLSKNDCADLAKGCEQNAKEILQLSEALARVEDASRTNASDIVASAKLHRDALEEFHLEHAKNLKDVDDSLRAAVEEIRSNLSALRSSVEPLVGKIEQLQARQDRTDANVGDAVTKMDQLQSRLTALEGIVSLLQPQDGSQPNATQNLSDFAETIRGLLESQSAADRNNSQLRDDLLLAKEQLSDLLQQLHALGGSHSALEKALRTLETSLGDMSAQNEKANSTRIGELESRMTNLVSQSSWKALCDDVDALKSKATSTGSAIEHKEKSRQPFDDALLQKDLDALKESLKRHEDAVSALRSDLSDRFAKMSEGEEMMKREIRTLGDECSKLALTSRAPAVSDVNPERQGNLQEPCDCHAKFSSLSKNLQSLSTDAARKEDVMRLAKELSDLRNGLSIPSVSTTQDTQSAGFQKQIQESIDQVVSNAKGEREWTQNQVIEIRTVVEHIHHTKADASAVALKADREYVENALEKLMREVEQVLNSTNAGLIDTLDKSLNILRDMIEGKATKQDLLRLKEMIGEGETPTQPEGLTGYKAYRCLGCNRVMEGMRPRPMGSNFSAFMNRVPTASRTTKPPPQNTAAQGLLPAPPGSA